MSTKVNKKREISPRFHLVYAWHKPTRRYVEIGACFCFFGKFSAVEFLRGACLAARQSWLKEGLELDSAIAMPCSTWFGFSTDELPF